MNIGNEAVEAIQNLRGNVAFERVVNAIGKVAYDALLSASRSKPEDRVNQTSYAAGVWDVWESLEHAYAGGHIKDVKRPPQPKVGAHAA